MSAEIYKALVELKDYGFRGQITRAGLSVPSNIAEGCERNTNKEMAVFLGYAKGRQSTIPAAQGCGVDTAKGSAGELRTQIYIGMEIGYIKREIGKQWLQEAEEISRMLHGLIQSTRKRIS